MSGGSPVVASPGHWNAIYSGRAETELGWYEPTAATLDDLLPLLEASGGSLIDIGAGSSRLADRLIELGHTDLTLLDLSHAALDNVADRLGPATPQMIVGNVIDFEPERTWDVWHDRATFHFLTDPDDRAAYTRVLDRSLAPGGHAVIAAFSIAGPEQCAGLPVVRYDKTTLAREFGDVLDCVGCRSHAGVGPGNDARPYVICHFQKNPGPDSGSAEES